MALARQHSAVEGGEGAFLRVQPSVAHQISVTLATARHSTMFRRSSGWPTIGPFARSTGPAGSGAGSFLPRVVLGANGRRAFAGLPYMERTGLEPVTFGLQSRRSPN